MGKQLRDEMAVENQDLKLSVHEMEAASEELRQSLKDNEQRIIRADEEREFERKAMTVEIEELKSKMDGMNQEPMESRDTPILQRASSQPVLKIGGLDSDRVRRRE